MNRVKDIVHEFKLHRNEIEIPIWQIKKNLEEYKGKIILYGAGSAGIAFFHYLQDVEIYPSYFADGDIDKHGKMCEGLEILAPDNIVERVGNDALVIVTINTDGKSYCKDFKKELLVGGHLGVHKKLKECGCKNVIDYTYFRRCYQLYKGEKYNLPACTDVYLMQEHMQEIEKVYNMLEDDVAQETFLKILEFRLISDQIDIPTFPEKGMYFEYDLFNKTADESFVDCGACGGSSLKEFLQINNDKFEQYYGIEPDSYNYNRLIKYINELDVSLRRKMKTFNAAAYEHDQGTSFYVLNGPGSFQAEEGPDFVDTIKIDEAVEQKKVSYIKMNIEGSEVSALKGAECTIRTSKPRLAIMGYHKTSDFWEVPLLIKEYYEEYNLSLRSYMHNVAFAYYAFKDRLC